MNGSSGKRMNRLPVTASTQMIRKYKTAPGVLWKMAGMVVSV